MGSSGLEALLAGGVPDLLRLSCERARFVAVLIPLAKGAAIKANRCLTLAPNFPPPGEGDGGADNESGSIVSRSVGQYEKEMTRFASVAHRRLWDCRAQRKCWEYIDRIEADTEYFRSI